MDNEHSNASQSAAAVADGVSSETKSPNSTAYCAKNVNTSTMAGSLNGSSSTNKIKLLIKASSQQFEDITIESDLLWTVKNLKAHLSHVYPSKPVSFFFSPLYDLLFYLLNVICLNLGYR